MPALVILTLSRPWPDVRGTLRIEGFKNALGFPSGKLELAVEKADFEFVENSGSSSEHFRLQLQPQDGAYQLSIRRTLGGVTLASVNLLLLSERGAAVEPPSPAGSGQSPGSGPSIVSYACPAGDPCAATRPRNVEFKISALDPIKGTLFLTGVPPNSAGFPESATIDVGQDSFTWNYRDNRRSSRFPVQLVLQPDKVSYWLTVLAETQEAPLIDLLLHPPGVVAPVPRLSTAWATNVLPAAGESRPIDKPVLAVIYNPNEELKRIEGPSTAEDDLKTTIWRLFETLCADREWAQRFSEKELMSLYSDAGLQSVFRQTETTRAFNRQEREQALEAFHWLGTPVDVEQAIDRYLERLRSSADSRRARSGVLVYIMGASPAPVVRDSRRFDEWDRKLEKENLLAIIVSILPRDRPNKLELQKAADRLLASSRHRNLRYLELNGPQESSLYFRHTFDTVGEILRRLLDKGAASYGVSHEPEAPSSAAPATNRTVPLPRAVPQPPPAALPISPTVGGAPPSGKGIGTFVFEAGPTDKRNPQRVELAITSTTPELGGVLELRGVPDNQYRFPKDRLLRVTGSAFPEVIPNGQRSYAVRLILQKDTEAYRVIVTSDSRSSSLPEGVVVDVMARQIREAEQR